VKKNCNFSLTKGGSIMIETFDLGDIVQMKKQHPCGSKEFEVIRLGADIKIKCVGCGRIVMIPRSKFQKDAKKVIKTSN
jgi:hypothetical protein